MKPPYVKPHVEEVSPRVIVAAEMLAVLRWLDHKGGLGLDVHERLRAVIAKAEATP